MQNNGNGNGGLKKKKPTREDLSKAAAAAHQLAESLDEAAGSQADQAPGRGSVQQQLKDAHDRFMDALAPYFERAGDKVRVEEKAAWTKIEGTRSGHKVYISKQKGTVKVECTLPVDAIQGAMEPERDNGRISSWLPDDPDVVGDAIMLIGEMDEKIPAPRRGGVAQDRGPQPGKKY